MIKLKHILTEKREFPADGITVMSLQTDRNEHTKARLTLAQVMKNKKFIGIYKAIENIQDIERFFPSELRKYRDSVDKELFKTAKKMYSNFKDINGAF
jgi:uncharacterized protein HemY